MILVSIDPGLRGCGCAAWKDGLLHRAAYVSGQNTLEEKNLSRLVENTTRWVARWILDARAGAFQIDALELVIEYPQTYGGRAAKGDANDLIGITLVAGAILGLVQAPTRLVRPAEWKGQVPKQTIHGTNPIELRARGKLSPAELERMDLLHKRLQHNVWDAVGIGLATLGR